ncbi:MAG: hypothetical protein ACFB0C_24960 [Leptolyngbyaceae cyanobacterium]
MVSTPKNCLGLEPLLTVPMVQRVQRIQKWQEPNQNGEVLHRITRTVIALQGVGQSIAP